MKAYRESSSTAVPILNLSKLRIYGFNLLENIYLAL